MFAFDCMQDLLCGYSKQLLLLLTNTSKSKIYDYIEDCLSAYAHLFPQPFVSLEIMTTYT